MAEQRRGTFLLFAAIAIVLVSCGGFFAYRYREGQRWREEIAIVGSCGFRAGPIEPEWLRKQLGSYGEPFRPIVEIRLGSHALDRKTRRYRIVEAGPWLERFATIKTLRRLDLQSNRTVTDDDIISLAASPPPALEELDLNRTETTDRSLEALATIPTLHELHISLTSVTEEGIDRLRIAQPDMKIVADPLTRRGLGRLSHYGVDATRRIVYGLPIPYDLTVTEAARVGRIPDPIWIGFFSPVSDDVLRTLARQSNIQSVVFAFPFSPQQVELFAENRSVKKLTVYAAHLRDEQLDEQPIDAICGIASLEQLLILSEHAEETLRNAIRERRPDLRVNAERPDLIGYRFNYRYEPLK
jgi:hypothetical protein